MTVTGGSFVAREVRHGVVVGKYVSTSERSSDKPGCQCDVLDEPPDVRPPGSPLRADLAASNGGGVREPGPRLEIGIHPMDGSEARSDDLRRRPVPIGVPV